MPTTLSQLTETLLETAPRLPPGPGYLKKRSFIRLIQGNTFAGLRELFRAFGTTVLAMQGLQYRHHPILKRVDRYGFVMISNAKGAAHVLLRNKQNYLRGDPMVDITLPLGQGLLTAPDGALHALHQTVLGKFFSRVKLQSLIPIMVERTEVLLKRWNYFAEKNDPIDLMDELTRVTLEISAKALFGFEIGPYADLVARGIRDSTNLVFDQMTAPWARVFKFFNRQRYLLFAKEQINIRTIFKRLIEDRCIERHNLGPRPADQKDLLDLMLDSRDKEQQSNSSAEGHFTDELICDEILTFLVASHETTAGALTWTHDLLCRNPEILDKLHRELDRTDFRQTPSVWSAAEQTLPYTHATVLEGLRHCPPAALMTRRSINEDVINGFRMPAKFNAHIFIWGIHRDKEVYGENAEAFLPERHLSQRFKAPEFMPFGYGPRACIGENFAMLELPILLAMTARTFKLKPLSNEPLGETLQINLRPQRAFLVQLEKRPLAQKLKG